MSNNYDSRYNDNASYRHRRRYFTVLTSFFMSETVFFFVFLKNLSISMQFFMKSLFIIIIFLNVKILYYYVVLVI